MEETKELQTTYKNIPLLDLSVTDSGIFSNMPLILNYWIIGVAFCAIFMAV